MTHKFPALAVLPAVAAAFFYSVACGTRVDIASALQVEALTSGWMAVEAPAAHSKLVPAISFRLRNVSQESLPVVQVNAIFRRGDATTEWGNAFQAVAGSDGLSSGAASRFIVLASQQGYTGTDPGPDLLDNSQFVDARVDLFGKYGSAPWTKLGEYAITRTLINP